jgi:para-aminobenzoate synthetase/4-amino-4-deoxychorismate lyase
MRPSPDQDPEDIVTAGVRDANEWLRTVRRMRCRPTSTPIGPGPDLAELLRRSAGAAGLVCLHGNWAGGGRVIAADPVVVLPPGADAITALGVLPELTDEDPSIVGGGWFGWLGYDSPARLAFYDHLVRVDADGQWTFETLWSPERDELLRQREQEWRARLTAAPLSAPEPTSPTTWQVGEFAGAQMPGHLAAVEHAIELIRAGEIYQVNVCTRLRASFEGSPEALFADAIASLQPAFGAYVAGMDRTLAAFSPELFLRRRGRQVTTSPIKGTWPASDPDGVAALRASTKDAAENVMIVDLMRNDLSRVCEVGSVRPTALLQVQKHPGVLHLVSTVEGRLRDKLSDADLLRAAFPPGSVTGAPKLRAMRAIADGEGATRGVYTGAVGFVSPNWGAEFAVVIRSFELAGSGIELGVGGGITADSVPMLEWRECLHKAAPLLTALGTGLVEGISQPSLTGLAAGGLLETIACRHGFAPRLADHLARLDRSSRELYRRGIPADAAAAVRAAVAQAGPGPAVARVQLTATGLAVQVSRAARRQPATAFRTVRGRTGLWRHKWADRSYLEAQEAEGEQAPLFVAVDGAVLETSRGNVFLLLDDGTLITAPLRDDLLPGVARRAVLDRARDLGRPTALRTFTIDELLVTPAFWTSSLSGAVPIASVDGYPLPRHDDAVATIARGVLEPD